MTVDVVPDGKINIVELEHFLRNPPSDFVVETHTGCSYVHSNDNCLVLIDDFQCCRGKVVFNNSLGRTIKMHHLWDYTRVRKSLLSKRIYMLVSACEQTTSLTNKRAHKAPKVLSVLKQFVLSMDGSDPFIKWELERGLNWTISSVAGESYRVKIDFGEALQTWAGSLHVLTDRGIVKPVWRDTSFTLKYYSDALFDFSHWFGFSKRQFKMRLT